MEQLNYNLLFRWFVDLGVDDAVWVPTVFTKNRDRLLDADVAAKFMAAVQASTTDPDAKLYRKSSNTAAKLCFIGHVLAENRHGRIVQADATRASNRAEREAAIAMIERHDPGSQRRLTLAADKGYDTKGFVAECRRMCVTPHVAVKVRHSALAGRTTRHENYSLSQRKRRLIEEAFGWAKTVAGQFAIAEVIAKPLTENAQSVAHHPRVRRRGCGE